MTIPNIALYFRVSGELRECPADLWANLLGPTPPNDFECNGCTDSPDFWKGIPTWIACRRHDWHYNHRCLPRVPQVLADLYLRLNLWRVARYYEAPWWRATYVCTVYWTAVRIAGSMAYEGAQGKVRRAIEKHVIRVGDSGDRRAA